MYRPKDPPGVWANIQTYACLIPNGMGDGKRYRNADTGPSPHSFIVIPKVNVHGIAKALCHARMMSQDCNGDWPLRQTSTCPSKDDITTCGFPIVWSGNWAYDYSEENPRGPKTNDEQRWERKEQPKSKTFDAAWEKVSRTSLTMSIYSTDLHLRN